MAEWEVWRQDENGQRYLVDAYHDRIHALARMLAFEAGFSHNRYPHKQVYEVVGERRPTLQTNRDLYLRLVAVGDNLAVTGRALLDYLCALWLVSHCLADHEELDGDHFVAMLTAAVTVRPMRPEPNWRTADFTADGQYVGFADFTKVLCTQIADLLAFEERPPDPLAPLGVDAPPRIDGGRATITRWCNFDPATFLECGAAGAFGGWSEADGRRVRTSDLRPEGAWSGEDIALLEPISWGDVAAFLEYGQSYE
jgi:hypothetical protein